MDKSPYKETIRKLLFEDQCSPEQIANRINLESDKSIISYPTIYRSIYNGLFDEGFPVGSPGARKILRRKGRKSVNKRIGDRRGRFTDVKTIHERPAKAETREELGHWEADTVLGHHGKSCLVTLVDRKSRFLLVEFEQNELEKEQNETFQEIFNLWFDNYKKTVKESTSMATERYIKIHVLPIIGNYKINQITVKMAQNAVNKWADKLQVYKVVLQYVSKVMDYAITLEIAQKHPFERVTRPKVKRTRTEKEVKFYTSDEVQKVLSHLEKRTKNVYSENLMYKYFAEWDLTMYRVLAFTGLRSGETLALTWNDIDFSDKLLTINKTLSQTKKSFEALPPKTKSSNRIISIDNKTCALLKKWQLRQKEFFFKIRLRIKILYSQIMKVITLIDNLCI